MFGAVIFLGAFLLFQVQFLIAKYILPWFGGSSAIWITSLFFFQFLLLAGYAYSHLIGRLARGPRLHAILLLLSLTVMGFGAWRWPSPITPAGAFGAALGPAAAVLTTLLVSVGLPFWLLSTSPLLQSWYVSAGASPYRMYSLSNAGSLLGLISYPFVIEPLLTIRQQAWIWCAAYVLFAAGSIACGWMARPSSAPARKLEPRRSPRPSSAQFAFWLLLPAATSALLLGSTNYILQDVAAVPLLWVVPLALYLLSFILTFASDRALPRWLLWPLFAISFAIACDGFFRRGHLAIRSELAYHGAALFFGCLCAHAELTRLKPAPDRLTEFYLSISAGSCIGSALVALAAPHIFPEIWEYHIALVLVLLLGIAAVLRDPGSWARTSPPWKVALGSAFLGFFPLLGLMTGLRIALPPLWKLLWVSCAFVLVVAAVLLGWSPRARWARWVACASLFLPVVIGSLVISVPMRVVAGALLARSRNFYGVIKVVELGRGNPDLDANELFHGRILHGLQLREPDLRRRATTYYSNLSGGGLALRYHPRRWYPDPKEQNIRFGIIGMGVGTLLTYGMPGDYARIYEINPTVVECSRGSDPYFTYLRDTRATADVVLGDARISMQAEADRGELQKFDVLLLDAFSGDAIPTHLLTRQAMQLYLRHLRDSNGLIAIHITNKFVDLEPVVSRLAQDLNMEGMIVRTKQRGAYINQSAWVLLLPGNSPLRTPALGNDVELADLGPAGPLWTDDFSNLFSILRASTRVP